MLVTVPEQNDKQLSGIPRALQHGVWSILLARQEKVMLAQGAHTIRSGTSVKSASFGSHILFKQVWCVIPLSTQQARTSAYRK